MTSGSDSRRASDGQDNNQDDASRIGAGTNAHAAQDGRDDGDHRHGDCAPRWAPPPHGLAPPDGAGGAGASGASSAGASWRHDGSPTRD